MSTNNRAIAHIINTAKRHDVTLPADLVQKYEASKALTFPATDYNTVVNEVAAAAFGKDFNKTVTAALDSLARNNVQFAQDVQRRVDSAVNVAWHENREDIADAFSGVIEGHLAVLNAKANTLPRAITRSKALDLPIDTLITYREVETAWAALDDIAAALKPFYFVSGHSIRGGLFDTLVYSKVPQQFDTLADAAAFRNALDGKRREYSTAMSSTPSDESVFKPAAIAGASPLDEPFAFALPSEYLARADRLTENLTPGAYRDRDDDARLFEPKPRGLVL